MLRFHGRVPSNLDVNEISEWYFKICESHHKVFRKIDLHFLNDEELLLVNQKFLDHDFYTDIITFDYCRGKYIIGEIYLSVDRILENSKKERVPFDTELYRVMAHGCLHLIGFKDKTPAEKAEMRDEENKALILQKI